MSTVDDLRQTPPGIGNTAERVAPAPRTRLPREQRRAFVAAVRRTDHNATATQQFADDETAGDSAMTELRREIERIDQELVRDDRGGGSGRKITRKVLAHETKAPALV